MQRPAAQVPLDVALLTIAAHGDPDLDVEAERRTLDGFASRCEPPTLDGLLRLLFRDEGFDGNREHYYDPRNSYLHEVVRRRTGIPITLSALTLEVGRRCGVPLSAVNLPGHFLLRDKVDRTVFVDPFHRGAVLDIDGVERLYAAMRPASPFDESLLDEPDHHDILRRVLANLHGIFLQNRDAASLAWVLELRAALPGSTSDEHRELARVHAARGDYLAAIRTLETALERTTGEAATAIHDDLRRIAAKLN